MAEILDLIDEAVIWLDPSDRVVLANRAASRLLGERGLHRDGQIADVAEHPLLRPLVVQARLGTSEQRELELANGTRTTVLARATCREDGSVVLVMHDVTEMRRLEHVRRDFVANVSHELRTPVSIIRANAETLLAGALGRPDQATRFVEALLRHADRLSRLIADLLDISRIEAGKYPIELAPQRVAPIIRRALDSVDTKVLAKSHTITVALDDALVANVDGKATEQVVVNLIENAIKYTPEAGQLKVTLSRVQGWAQLEIEDDGPGIDEIHRPRVFERFYRVDPGRSREMGGTGLGLAIVKHLVEVMHGAVWVEPATPHGSRFLVRLSIAPSAA